MKSLVYNTAKRNNGFNYPTKTSNRFNDIYNNKFDPLQYSEPVTKETLLTQDAYIQMAAGSIPD